MSNYKKILTGIIVFLFLNACNGKIPGADARKIPYDPDERVKRNLEEGRGFRIDEAFSKTATGTEKSLAYGTGAGLGGIAEGLFVDDVEEVGSFGDFNIHSFHN